jgi:Tol biopolymer transport system component
MINRAQSQASSRALSPSEIRTQLEKVLASDVFARSERLSSLLQYVVEKTLEGSQHVLKEQTIAEEFLRRGPLESGAADPIVRVEARRLRDKLREYYATANDPIVISLPKGSYVPTFAHNPAEHDPATTPVIEPNASRRFGRPKIAAAGIVVIAAIAAGWYALKQPTPARNRIRPLTSLPGLESAPTLSPDGNFVVFAWSNGAPADLYIKTVDSESISRLTETPQPEGSPAWSPDGRAIAFVRGGEGVFIVSPLGGRERKISAAGTHVRWAADSQSVFIRTPCSGSPDKMCIDNVRIDTLEHHEIVRGEGATHSPRGPWTFSASPDGQTLAFIWSQRPGVSDIYMVPSSGGRSKRLTKLNATINSVDWMPDGKSLIYSADTGRSGRFRLSQIAENGSPGPGDALVAGQVESVEQPSVAGGRRGGSIRIAYSSFVRNVSLRRVEIQPSGPEKPIGTAYPFAFQTGSHDCGSAFSPDSRQYVFRSYRSGEGMLWVVGTDGSNLHPLDALKVMQARPFESSWSPDGRHLAFELISLEGNSDIYVSDIDGGHPLRLTTENSIDALPSWSADGHWVYFLSDRSGSFRIWKIPARGGPAEVVTPGFGFEPRPSPDGQYIYYLSCMDSRHCPLKRIPASGGPETVVLDRVIADTWSVTSQGIYFLTREAGKDWLDLFDPARGKRSRIGSVPFKVNIGGPFCVSMSVSPDGKTLIGNEVDRFESNLMLLEISR